MRRGEGGAGPEKVRRSPAAGAGGSWGGRSGPGDGSGSPTVGLPGSWETDPLWRRWGQVEGSHPQAPVSGLGLTQRAPLSRKEASGSSTHGWEEGGLLSRLVPE